MIEVIKNSQEIFVSKLFTIVYFITTQIFDRLVSARCYKIGLVGNNWLVGWLVGVGNTVFSETARRIFLFFCMMLGDYNGRKVTESDF